MAFVKLDCGILRSTLWMDREAREVFITALLMAEPQEFDHPVPQLRVRTLEPTGWEAPPGWYGFVPAAGIGIVDSAKLDREPGLAALERLGSPDFESRSQDFEGRRLIRVDGGYLVLNYMRYRDRDYTGADRAKRYRERLKARNSHVTSQPLQRDESPSHRDITQAECRVQSSDPDQNTSAPAALVPQEPETPTWWLDFKLAYPSRAGDQKWRGAMKAARARIREGHTPQEFVDGARRYAAFIRDAGKENTEFVKQAATFLGRDKAFLELWKPGVPDGRRTEPRLTRFEESRNRLLDLLPQGDPLLDRDAGTVRPALAGELRSEPIAALAASPRKPD